MPITRPTRSRWLAPWGPTSVAPRARNDDELLVAAGAGDHQAFATLRGHMVGLVHANIWRALPDKTRTSSVVDETFVEVWRQAAGFDPAHTPAVIWILDLAHRLAAEHVGGPIGARSADHDSSRDQPPRPAIRH